MVIEQYSAVSRPQFGLRAIKEQIRSQISFWLWDRKLSKQYNDIMKHNSDLERTVVNSAVINNGVNHA